jgi:hypothetical protein
LTTASAAAAAEIAALLATGGSSAQITTVDGVVEGSMVHVERRRTAMHYSLGNGAKPFFKLNLKHHTKLERLWRAKHKATLAAAKVNPNSGGEGAPDAGAGTPKKKRLKHKHIKMGPVERASFNHAVWRLLARYSSIGGAGFQAAVGSAGFDVLSEELAVDWECFASPLNCRQVVFLPCFVSVAGLCVFTSEAPFPSEIIALIHALRAHPKRDGSIDPRITCAPQARW